jgi:DNA-binding CsgD family transcriptional regulator
MPKWIDPDVAALGAEMLRYAKRVEEFDSPDKVLDGLHNVSSPACGMNVLAAALFPLQWGDWSAVEKGKTVFLHHSAPKGWWEEWLELSRAHPGPGLSLARLSIAPFTQSDVMRLLEPLATDRWPYELALKHGMRDGLACPVGGRWIVAFWSRTLLSQRLSEEARAILFMGATFAVIRLQKLVGPQVSRIGRRDALTPRELAVLRLLAEGNRVADIAKHLGLGQETVRSHLKKAQARLAARNSTHAVAQAIRRQLIV